MHFPESPPPRPPNDTPLNTKTLPPRRRSAVNSSGKNLLLLFLSAARNSPQLTAVQSFPPIDSPKRLPGPELGLLSLLLALSVAITAIISVALISIPTAIALRRSAVATERLVRVAAEEVPGTLYSLRLSGMEIGDLTRELRRVRRWVSANRDGKNGGGK